MTENAAGKFYIDEILKSQGTTVLNRLHSHSFTINILIMNARALRKAITLSETAEFMIKTFNVENEDKSNQFHREVNRLVHNYLCAVSTYVDHTRNFMRRFYNETAFHKAYCREIDRLFIKDSYACFVKDLRNYITHRGLPNSKMNLQLKNLAKSGDHENIGEVTSGISYKTSEFKEWKKWSANARQFLETSGEELLLSEVFLKHFAMMESFIKWFDAAFRHQHKRELEDLENLNVEYLRLESENA